MSGNNPREILSIKSARPFFLFCCCWLDTRNAVFSQVPPSVFDWQPWFTQFTPWRGLLSLLSMRTSAWSSWNIALTVADELSARSCPFCDKRNIWKWFKPISTFLNGNHRLLSVLIASDVILRRFDCIQRHFERLKNVKSCEKSLDLSLKLLLQASDHPIMSNIFSHTL